MEHNVKDVFKYQINKPELKERFMDFVYKNKGKYGIHNQKYNEDNYFTTTLFSEDLVKAFYESLKEKWFSQNILKDKDYVETRGPYSYSPRDLNKDYNVEIDYDIILNNGKKLQREFVWTIEQKRELILSILKDIPFGYFQASILSDGNRAINKQIFRIIDGKQRLSTIIDFVQGKFGFIWNDVEYFIDDLEIYTKNKFRFISLEFKIIYEYPDARLTDEQLIAWFERVNFSGTPQDKEHLKYLKQK